MDYPTIGGAAAAAGMSSWLFWKMLIKNIDNKQDNRTCDERHKAIDRADVIFERYMQEGRESRQQLREAVLRIEEQLKKGAS